MIRSILKKSVSSNYLFVNGLNRLSKLNYCKKEEKGAGEDVAKETDREDIRHNFHQDCEDGLNEQINCELYASYTYFCMSNCLSRPDVALFGFAEFFRKASLEEQGHASELARFVQMRGGTVMLCDVLRPEPSEYHSPEIALQESISLEKNVLKSIEELHKKASGHNDVLLMDFLESRLIPEQYEGIRQLTEMLTAVKRAGPGAGVVLLDLDLRRNPPNSTHDSGHKY